MARRNKRRKQSKRGGPSSKAALLRAAKKAKERYVAIKIKDYIRYRGPTLTVLGSSKTLKGAQRVVMRGKRSGLHAVVDSKTGKVWTAIIPRLYIVKY